MSEESATIEVTAEIKTLGDQIADLTLKQAKELSDYLENEYDIKPAAGGAVVAMAPGAGGAGGLRCAAAIGESCSSLELSSDSPI